MLKRWYCSASKGAILASSTQAIVGTVRFTGARVRSFDSRRNSGVCWTCVSLRARDHDIRTALDTQSASMIDKASIPDF